MIINHHLDESTLFSYVAGALSQGLALAVASHISLCKHCQNRASGMEGIGGALLDQIAPETIHESSLEDVLARLDDIPLSSASGSVMSRPNSKFNKPKPRLSDVPVPLNEYIGESLDAVKWKRLIPGFFYIDIFTKGEGTCRLLKVNPGKSILPHGHQGSELTLLLRGSFSDDRGQFNPGDISDLDNETEHELLADSEQGCICLLVTDAPLRFLSPWGKLIQRVTGF
ncbi:MAG: transcriptional regulator [Porticoccaceae bacterium]|nr:MAG: transcriptional regulator [Porticoccaceae bacterium]